MSTLLTETHPNQQLTQQDLYAIAFNHALNFLLTIDYSTEEGIETAKIYFNRSFELCAKFNFLINNFKQNHLQLLLLFAFPPDNSYFIDRSFQMKVLHFFCETLYSYQKAKQDISCLLECDPQIHETAYDYMINKVPEDDLEMSSKILLFISKLCITGKQFIVHSFINSLNNIDEIFNHFSDPIFATPVTFYLFANIVNLPKENEEMVITKVLEKVFPILNLDENGIPTCKLEVLQRIFSICSQSLQSHYSYPFFESNGPFFVQQANSVILNPELIDKYIGSIISFLEKSIPLSLFDIDIDLDSFIKRFLITSPQNRDSIIYLITHYLEKMKNPMEIIDVIVQNQLVERIYDDEQNFSVVTKIVVFTLISEISLMCYHPIFGDQNLIEFGICYLNDCDFINKKEAQHFIDFFLTVLQSNEYPEDLKEQIKELLEFSEDIQNIDDEELHEKIHLLLSLKEEE